MHGLILHRPGSALGGDVTMVEDYAAALNALGQDIEVEYRPADRLNDLDRYDFVHLWAACSPDWGYPAAQAVRTANKPLLIMPMWWSRTQRQAFYGHPDEDLFPGYTRYVASTLLLADVLTVSTMAEAVECWRIAPGVPVIKSGLSCRRPMVTKTDNVIIDRVICLGRVEGHKNQHSLAQACERLGVHLLCVGPIVHEDIARAASNHGAQLTGALPWAEAMELLVQSWVHALPSFSEAGGTANMEACLLGVPSVMGMTTEPEFFGEGGVYCDPTSIDSIEQAVAEAWSRPRRPWATIPIWAEVAQKVATWLTAHI